MVPPCGCPDRLWLYFGVWLAPLRGAGFRYAPVWGLLWNGWGKAGPAARQPLKEALQVTRTPLKNQKESAAASRFPLGPGPLSFHKGLCGPVWSTRGLTRGAKERGCHGANSEGD